MKLSIKISTTRVAFYFLCAYISVLYLVYLRITSIPLQPLALDGFLLFGTISILQRNKIKLNEHIFWYTLFTLIVFIGVLYSPSMFRGIPTFINQAKVLIYILMIVQVIESEKDIYTLITVQSVSSFVLVVFLFINGELFVEERLGQSLTGNANVFASALMFGAIASIYGRINTKSRKMKTAFVILFFVQLFALSLSASRKNFLMPILIFFGIYFFELDRFGQQRILKKIFIIGVAVIVIAWSVFNVPILYENIGKRFEGMIGSMLGVGKSDLSADIRFDMIKTGLRLWITHPIFGYGTNSFAQISGFGCYSHNNFTEILVSVGIFGFAVYYGYIIHLLYRIYKSQLPKNQKNFWFLTILAMVIYDYGAVTFNEFDFNTMYILAFLSQFIERNNTSVHISNKEHRCVCMGGS